MNAKVNLLLSIFETRATFHLLRSPLNWLASLNASLSVNTDCTVNMVTLSNLPVDNVLTRDTSHLLIFELKFAAEENVSSREVTLETSHLLRSALNWRDAQNAALSVSVDCK